MAKAFVQQSPDSSITTGQPIAYPSDVGSGVLLVAAGVLTSVGATISGITDTLGNTWALARRRAGTSGGAGTDRNITIWYASCPTGGANSITPTISAGSFFGIVAEWSGFTNGVSVDQVGDNELTANALTIPNGTLTTTVAESVIVASLAFATAFSVSSRLTGFNALNGSARGDHQYKITSATETTDAAVTTASSEKAVGVIANFYETSGGGPTADIRRQMMMHHL